MSTDIRCSSSCARDIYALFEEDYYCCKCKPPPPPPPRPACFPSDAKVDVENGKSIRMSELQIRDQLQTGMKSVAMYDLQAEDRVQTGMNISNNVCTRSRRQSTNRYESVTMSDLGDRVKTGMKSVRISALQAGDRVQTGMNQ